tara:strand:- start:189 stop:542 length:354 start_codon:yes stop_codon:yes gene_type:complete
MTEEEIKPKVTFSNEEKKDSVPGADLNQIMNTVLNGMVNNLPQMNEKKVKRSRKCRDDDYEKLIDESLKQIDEDDDEDDEDDEDEQDDEDQRWIAITKLIESQHVLIKTVLHLINHE